MGLYEYRTLKHVAQYSPLLSENVKRQIQTVAPGQPSLKQRFSPDQLPLSELPYFISGKYALDVPVYTVWGACEDVRVLEKFRSGEYKINNLHIIDESSSRLLDIGGIKLRLLGLGGAVVMHKLFDNGEGRTTIAGGQGTMWTTLLQMGELVDTATRVYDPAETRVFITHASPAREGLLNQLSVTLKADFSISAGLHFRYGSSYNEFSVNPTLDHYRGKLAASKASFTDVWETVKGEVEPAVSQNEAQKVLLQNALEIVTKMPTVANGGNPFGGANPGQAGAGQVDESAFKNMWNFNLADAAFGYLVLEIEGGRIGTEMRAQGFNFAHRQSGGKQMPHTVMAAQQSPAPNQMRPSQVPPQASQVQRAPPTTAPVASTQAVHQQVKQPIQQQSPAPVVTVGKPTTPQPSGQANVNIPNVEKSPASHANGTPTPSHVKPQPSPSNLENTSLFASGYDTEEEVRNALSAEARNNIMKVHKIGNGLLKNYSVQFNTHDNAQSALDSAPKQSPGNGRTKQYFRWYEDRRNYNRDGQSGGGWGPSNRGASGTGPRPGYQSGASDSEGARGRGGYRGRGTGRGNDRGDRGDRGNRGNRGRGGFNKTGSGGEEAAAAPAKPATETPA